MRPKSANEPLTEQTMNIAILGRGIVGETLGSRWVGVGHSVVYGSRSPGAADELFHAEAVQRADVVVIALPWAAMEPDFLADLELGERLVIDCTNPIAADFSDLVPVEAGSGAERVAQAAPHAKVVKAFNTIGVNIMANPAFGTSKATLLIAGDDAAAKATVATLAEELGFQPEDAGPLSMSRYLEAQAWIWISMAMKFGYGREIAFNLQRR